MVTKDNLLIFLSILDFEQKVNNSYQVSVENFLFYNFYVEIVLEYTFSGLFVKFVDKEVFMVHCTV